MLSRVADSIYWLSRYIERAENIARFVQVNLNLMLELSSTDEAGQWLPMVITTGDRSYFESKYGEATQENVLRFLSYDADYDNSIFSCVRMARENARTVREAISSEMWTQVNYFYQLVKRSAAEMQALTDPNEFFTQIKRQSHLFSGITAGTLRHGEGWHFHQVGQLLERADKTSRILDVKYFLLLPKEEGVGTALDKLQWAAVLRSASGLEMYRKKYHRITPAEVADFLILDRLFPRSIHHCLIEAEASLHAISGSPPMTFSNSAEKCLGRLRSEFTYTTIDEIFRLGLHEYLDGFQTQLNETGDAIFESYFALSSPAAL